MRWAVLLLLAACDAPSVAREPSRWPAGSKIVGGPVCFERHAADGGWIPAVLESHDGRRPVKGAAVSGVWYLPGNTEFRGHAEFRVRVGDCDALGAQSAEPQRGSLRDVLQCPVDVRDFGDGPNAAEMAAKYNATCAR